MQIFTVILLLVIISTICFIGYVFRWLNEQRYKKLYFQDTIMMPRVIERAYKAVDLQTMVQYQDMNDFMNGGLNHRYSDVVIKSKEHKNYMIKDQIRSLADEMLNQGLIEIDDRIDISNPYRKVLRLKVKVYKPD